MNKSDLSLLSGASLSFISDITNGKGNPSLEKMEAIAKALDVPLPCLLETTDWNKKELKLLDDGFTGPSLPAGFKWVTVILPDHRATKVEQWGEEAKNKILGKK